MSYIGGLYTGAKYFGVLINNPEQVALMDEYLKAIVEAREEDSVISLFMMPSDFYTEGDLPVIKNVSILRPDNLFGYHPKNKKLLTYPYSFICADTGNDSKNYRFEWTQNKNIMNFALACSMTPDVEILVIPKGYNGTEVGEQESGYNATEMVVCNGFPQCAFSVDTFRQWVVGKGTNQFLGLVGNVIGASAQTISGNLVGGTLGFIGANQSANSLVLDATKGASSRGNIGTSTSVGMRIKGVYFKHMCVTEQYAKMIDDFFNRYGYACCRTKIPNRAVRPHWTYTKTQKVSIRGRVPVDDLEKIKSIYDNGITFWKQASLIGRYDLDNSPVESEVTE